ncbi:LOW QUALITY PROTEIN: hypothetical protein Cgig2_003119 [Carnegiea gigantea]|uniref:Uncharacterized protein n=1 Tax=Carnegiea gigantea TaxID=171969 RepID=A0A9Q1GV93_9CARY|nr:LOW QUALITY PROTEIN: hypothetical protein Cgig2_003119 [Carnegiea gigantea]
MANLSVIKEGELAAFLLSRFILPYDKEVTRPETFVMVVLIAYGQQISLAPMVLRYTHHGLGEATSHPDHPTKANTNFPDYYVIGRLAELFPYLYPRRPDSDDLGDFSILICYVGLLGSKRSLSRARHVFRDGRYLSLRVSSYRKDSRNGRDVIDMRLLDEGFKFLLSTQSSVLPKYNGLSQALPIFKGEIWGLSSMFLLPIMKDGAVEISGVMGDSYTKDKPSISSFKKGKTKEDWVRESILKGAEVIISIISNHGSTRDFARRSMIDIYKRRAIETCLFSSKIEDICGIVETAVKIEELMDVDLVKALSDQDLTCSSEIAHIEGQVNNLSSETSKLKAKVHEIMKKK